MKSGPLPTERPLLFIITIIMPNSEFVPIIISMPTDYHELLTFSVMSIIH